MCHLTIILSTKKHIRCSKQDVVIAYQSKLMMMYAYLFTSGASTTAKRLIFTVHIHEKMN